MVKCGTFSVCLLCLLLGLIVSSRVAVAANDNGVKRPDDSALARWRLEQRNNKGEVAFESRDTKVAIQCWRRKRSGDVVIEVNISRNLERPDFIVPVMVQVADKDNDVMATLRHGIDCSISGGPLLHTAAAGWHRFYYRNSSQSTPARVIANVDGTVCRIDLPSRQ